MSEYRTEYTQLNTHGHKKSLPRFLPEEARFTTIRAVILEFANVLRRRALIALHDFELYTVTLVESLESITLN